MWHNVVCILLVLFSNAMYFLFLRKLQIGYIRWLVVTLLVGGVVFVLPMAFKLFDRTSHLILALFAAIVLIIGIEEAMQALFTKMIIRMNQGAKEKTDNFGTALRTRNPGQKPVAASGSAEGGGFNVGFQYAPAAHLDESRTEHEEAAAIKEKQKLRFAKDLEKYSQTFQAFESSVSLELENKKEQTAVEDENDGFELQETSKTTDADNELDQASLAVEGNACQDDNLPDIEPVKECKEVLRWNQDEEEQPPLNVDEAVDEGLLLLEVDVSVETIEAASNKAISDIEETSSIEEPLEQPELIEIKVQTVDETIEVMDEETAETLYESIETMQGAPVEAAIEIEDASSIIEPLEQQESEPLETEDGEEPAATEEPEGEALTVANEIEQSAEETPEGMEETAEEIEESIETMETSPSEAALEIEETPSIIEAYEKEERKTLVTDQEAEKLAEAIEPEAQALTVSSEIEKQQTAEAFEAIEEETAEAIKEFIETTEASPVEEAMEIEEASSIVEVLVREEREPIEIEDQEAEEPATIEEPNAQEPTVSSEIKEQTADKMSAVMEEETSVSIETMEALLIEEKELPSATAGIVIEEALRIDVVEDIEQVMPSEAADQADQEVKDAEYRAAEAAREADLEDIVEEAQSVQASSVMSEALSTAFDLKFSGSFAEAAQAFERAKADIADTALKFKIDIEIISSLLLADASAKATDKLFETLAAGYELDDESRSQIEMILMSLQNKG